MIDPFTKRTDRGKKNPDKAVDPLEAPEEQEIGTKNPGLPGIEKKNGAGMRDRKPAIEMIVPEIGVKNPDPKVEKAKNERTAEFPMIG